MNVIHWRSKDNWKPFTDSILKLGDNIIIETPPAGDDTTGKEYLGDINDYILKQSNIEILGEFQRHTCPKKAKMYLIKKNKNIQEKPKGIKLTTFMNLNGIFPKLLNQ